MFSTGNRGEYLLVQVGMCSKLVIAVILAGVYCLLVLLWDVLCDSAWGYLLSDSGKGVLLSISITGLSDVCEY